MNGTGEKTVGECVDHFIYGDTWDGLCLQLLVSKAIGYVIVIMTSILIKLPQIIKLLKARSSEGLSTTSEFLQLVTNSTACSYSIAKAFPFSTWGESIFMAVQSLIICILILIYKKRLHSAVVTVALYVVIMCVLMSQLTPDIVRAFLQFTTLPFVIISKILQIWANYQRNSTGVLSAISVFTFNFRSVGRLFTHLRETGDPIKIAIYSAGTFLNVILSAQVIYYNIQINPNKANLKEKRG